MFKTAECVSPKHPDKLCDQISDAILDECLRQDPDSRVAIETMGGHNIITITGELTTNAYVDIPAIVRSIVGNDYGIQTNIVKQSPEIGRGVDEGGAGDQGIMVGYACDDNEALIPQELYLARSLCKFIYSQHEEDGKTQITLGGDGKIQTIVASFCGISTADLKEFIRQWNMQCASEFSAPEIEVHANPAGDWNIGGFAADTGVTGRKLAVDNYGPNIPIGGGAFSGKDPSKVDRSGAYLARRLAIDILKSEGLKEVTVKLAYAIGVAEPVMATATCINKEGQGVEFEIKNADLRPKTIIDKLKLKTPQYQEVAKWGSFGRMEGYTWDL